MKIASCALSTGFLLAQITFGAAVQCYICSWSPDDNNNRTDFCTDDNFQKNILVIDDCKKGCEVFVQWDANDRMEHIRRNCVDGDDPMREGCDTEQSVWWVTKRCVCSSDLCNNADLSGSPVTFCASAVTTSILTIVGLLVKLKIVGSV